MASNSFASFDADRFPDDLEAVGTAQVPHYDPTELAQPISYSPYGQMPVPTPLEIPAGAGYHRPIAAFDIEPNVDPPRSKQRISINQIIIIIGLVAIGMVITMLIAKPAWFGLASKTDKDSNKDSQVDNGEIGGGIAENEIQQVGALAQGKVDLIKQGLQELIDQANNPVLVACLQQEIAKISKQNYGKLRNDLNGLEIGNFAKDIKKIQDTIMSVCENGTPNPWNDDFPMGGGMDDMMGGPSGGENDSLMPGEMDGMGMGGMMGGSNGGMDSDETFLKQLDAIVNDGGGQDDGMMGGLDQNGWEVVDPNEMEGMMGGPSGDENVNLTPGDMDGMGMGGMMGGSNGGMDGMGGGGMMGGPNDNMNSDEALLKQLEAMENDGRGHDDMMGGPDQDGWVTDSIDPNEMEGMMGSGNGGMDMMGDPSDKEGMRSGSMNKKGMNKKGGGDVFNW